MSVLDNVIMDLTDLEKTVLYTPKDVVKTTKTIYVMMGLPGSGKSTLAEQMTSGNKNKLVRINKDDIRAMLQTKFSKPTERLVESISREAGMDALNMGFDIIIDDTNFAKKHIDFWLIKAMENQYTLVKYFMNTPLQECIRRDLVRPKMVGAAVIKMMHNKHLRETATPEDRYSVQDKSLPKAVLVDLDGTLTIFDPKHRGAFEYHKVDGDAPNMPIVRMVQMYVDAGCYPIFVTGREDTGNCRIDSTDWIARMFPTVMDFTLHMRHKKNFEKDHVIKKAIYDKYIVDKYFVEMTFEDRNSIVDLYRKGLKLPCVQVNYGDF